MLMFLMREALAKILPCAAHSTNTSTTDGNRKKCVILILIKLNFSLTISTWKIGLNYLIDSYRPTINSNNANYFTFLFLPHDFLQIAAA